MATYTITTNQNQEDALTWIVQQSNDERAKRNLPQQTNEEYFVGLMEGYLKNWTKKHQRENILGPLEEMWDTLTNGQINQIKKIVGL